MSDKHENEVGPVLAKAQPVQPAPAQRVPSAMGATFAERKAAREAADQGDDAEGKAVEAAENKAVRSARSK